MNICPFLRYLQSVGFSQSFYRLLQGLGCRDPSLGTVFSFLFTVIASQMDKWTQPMSFTEIIVRGSISPFEMVRGHLQLHTAAEPVWEWSHHRGKKAERGIKWVFQGLESPGLLCYGSPERFFTPFRQFELTSCNVYLGESWSPQFGNFFWVLVHSTSQQLFPDLLKGTCCIWYRRPYTC